MGEKRKIKKGDLRTSSWFCQNLSTKQGEVANKRKSQEVPNKIGRKALEQECFKRWKPTPVAIALTPATLEAEAGGWQI